jgi:YegS/Rv2252/BmrU family lipid kinase
MRLTIVANPTSGRGRVFRKLRKYLRDWPYSGWECTLLETHGPEHAGILAGEACLEPPDILAVCGGDGTMKEVVSSLPDPPCPVGIIPAGTTNLLAHEIGMPLNLQRAVEVILNGDVRRVDLGVLNGRALHRFLLMAGIGFDGYVVARLRPAAKRHLGTVAYAAKVLKSHLTYGFEEFQVLVEGKVFPATSCLVANASSYGGGLRFTPDADMSDGLLEILVVQSASARAYARFIFSAWAGKVMSLPFIRRMRSRSLRLEGPRSIWVQADGEAIGTLPVEISVAQSAFPLIVPPPAAGKMRGN